MIPSFNNLFIQLLKGSALLYFIAAGEITDVAQLLRPQFGGDIVFLYTTVLVLYLLLAIVITVVMRFLERLGAAMLGRTPPKRKRLFAKVPEAVG
jgi:polar amino acid transport system permease protein